jgi:Cu(I)/Ag(I) efflux system membrane fusion protein
MDIYSPELLTAQQNLLFLLKNDADNISLIKTAENRLLLMGMSENQLNQIKKDKKPLMSISVYSNYSGYVYEKGVLESSTTLSLKEGNYVKKGQALFQINDKNKAWIVFDAFPEDIAFVKVGEAVKIIPDASPENDFEAKIGFVEPFYVNNSKTLKARIYFDNKLQKLSIGSQIKVLIENEIPKSYWLPKSAVISLGDKQIVFVKQRNTFSPKTIQTGVKTEELIQIVDGLENDNEICVNASFLIDNESLIKPN